MTTTRTAALMAVATSLVVLLVLLASPSLAAKSPSSSSQRLQEYLLASRHHEVSKKGSTTSRTAQAPLTPLRSSSPSPFSFSPLEANREGGGDEGASLDALLPLNNVSAAVAFCTDAGTAVAVVNVNVTTQEWTLVGMPAIIVPCGLEPSNFTSGNCSCEMDFSSPSWVNVTTQTAYFNYRRNISTIDLVSGRTTPTLCTSYWFENGFSVFAELPSQSSLVGLTVVLPRDDSGGKGFSERWASTTSSTVFNKTCHSDGGCLGFGLVSLTTGEFTLRSILPTLSDCGRWSYVDVSAGIFWIVCQVNTTGVFEENVVGIEIASGELLRVHPWGTNLVTNPQGSTFNLRSSSLVLIQNPYQGCYNVANQYALAMARILESEVVVTHCLPLLNLSTNVVPTFSESANVVVAALDTGTRGTTAFALLDTDSGRLLTNVTLYDLTHHELLAVVLP